MKCKLVKLNSLSGKAASIYTVVVNSDQETMLDKFINESSVLFKDETKDIISRLKTIGHKTGGREQYFKKNEGIPGDGVCALYDDPDSNLRLYCICFGTQLIVVGNGGHKSKSIRALQDDIKLRDENYFLRWLSNQIMKRIKERNIRFINNYLDFEGDLEFITQDE